VLTSLLLEVKPERKKIPRVLRVDRIMSLVKREVGGVAQKTASFVVQHGRCNVDEIALRPKLCEVCERARKEHARYSQSSAVHIIATVLKTT
jgi:hypothetical protein